MKKNILAFICVGVISLCFFGCDKKAPETTENSSNISEVPLSDPVTNISEMFSGASEDAYVPFQDPERSFCWNKEGYAGPVLYQSTGSCDIYAGVTVMDVNYQIKHGELPFIEPLDILDRIYVADPDDPDSPEGL